MRSVYVRVCMFVCMCVWVFAPPVSLAWFIFGLMH